MSLLGCYPANADTALNQSVSKLVTLQSDLLKENLI